MRKYLRMIAKARLRAIGADRVNRRLRTTLDGVKVWRRILEDDKAHNAQAKGRKPVIIKAGKKVSA